MPTLYQERGYRFFFFTREGREPPHIHVEHAGNYAKFWLSPVRLARSKGFRSHEFSEVLKIIEKHATFFEEKWHEIHGA